MFFDDVVRKMTEAFASRCAYLERHGWKPPSTDEGSRGDSIGTPHGAACDGQGASAGCSGTHEASAPTSASSSAPTSARGDTEYGRPQPRGSIGARRPWPPRIPAGPSLW